MYALKQAVLDANLDLPRQGLVRYTWGNVSGIDRARGLVVIKPSGVAYDALTLETLSVVDLETGQLAEGLTPSSDTATHLALYRAFPGIGGVVHTHSRWATIFAQSGRGIPPLGTTHADDFYGEIPCTAPMSREAIAGEYELNTGLAIAARLGECDPMAVPAALVHGHGPFAWGADPGSAVYKAVVMEEAAMMAWHTLLLEPAAPPISQDLLDKHWLRKHGKDAYYGQR